MRFIYHIFLLLSLVSSSGWASENDPASNDLIRYRVTRSDYVFSTVFNMETDKGLIGSVVKSSFHLKTNYDSYDRSGLYEGRGIYRLVSLGLFYSWATEIDIYNLEDEKIGMIDGQIWTTGPAKFSFYDASDQCVAIAYLDKNRLGFTLVDPNYPSFTIARLTRNFIRDTVDNWDVVIYHPDLIPAELVKIFATFACDTQNKFKPDL
ncbi:MAG: hypothetical protein K0S07_972 [Chlamydiales bacterium]|jgi:hypothetical protein|nr:hypothetical protein [Chlamydiales bacterium]